MKMTPSKPTAYISDLLQFTYSAVYSQFRLTRSFILYIKRMRGWTLCGPSLYQFPVRWRKAGHYITIFFQLFTLTSRHLPLRDTAPNNLFTQGAAKRPNTSTLYALSLSFPQLSSRRSTSTKTWSTCTPSWTSAFSLGWRWAPIHRQHSQLINEPLSRGGMSEKKEPGES